MSEVAIRVEDLGKKYNIGSDKAADLRNAFGNFVKKYNPFSDHQLTKSHNLPIKEFWALKDINFKVKKGEAVGIIGRNGAGKSTLLKILSRITEPTTGHFILEGRVSSLLEVGTGFHMELTGRENIYLNGTILGMKRREIKDKFDEIVAFSGVEKFIDTPVKHYSSGMKVRLAFSVAAHLEPEILVVDEVLAVGDAEFQKKCLGKMEDVTGQGRTVLFVSHNMGAVKKLCNYGILLDEGKIIIKHNVDNVISHYMNVIETYHNQKHKLFQNEEISLNAIFLKDKIGNQRKQFDSLEDIYVTQEIKLKKDIVNFKIGIEVVTPLGIKVFSSFHNDRINLSISNTLTAGNYAVTTIIPRKYFNQGEFHVNVLFGIHRVRWIYELQNVANFSINFSIENPYFSANKRDSILAPMLEWHIN